MIARVGKQRATAGIVVGVTAIACLVLGGLLGSRGLMTGLLGAALLVLTIGTAVVFLQPRVIYCVLAFALGAIPAAMVPGFPLPIILVLALAVWVAVLTHPIAETRTCWLELSVALLVVTSLVSFIMTFSGSRDLIEFAKWLIATSMVFALLRLGWQDLRLFGTVFVFGAWIGALFAMAIYFFDKSGNSLNLLSFIGYGRTSFHDTHLRFYILGDSMAIRLTGTYIDPNGAGINMLIALALALALLRGWHRRIVAPVLLAALIITLSRAAIVSFLVAIVLFVLFQRMSTGRRLVISVTPIIGAAGCLMVPVMYNRFVNSFSERDIGSMDRLEAISHFTHVMSGSWWFGLGWGRPEFIDDVAAYKTNVVANSPLLTLYRGGIFPAIAFVLVLLAGAFLAYRCAREEPWESGVIGAIFVGFALVGLQLDYPVVTIAPATMVWSMLIAFLAANPIRKNEATPETEAIDSTQQMRARGSSSGGKPSQSLQYGQDCEIQPFQADL